MVEEDTEDAEDGGGIPSELIASYLAFGVRALKRGWLLGSIVFVAVAGLTLAVATLWPRTYHCETRLIAQQSNILARGDSVNDALRGAPDLVQRIENLEAIVHQLDLLRVMQERRPFISRVKDAVMSHIRGESSEKDRLEALVWTLKDKLEVTVSITDATLTMTIDWPDPQSAAQILKVAEDNFLEARHVAEISTIAEYASILEGHAATLRGEVDDIARQLRELKAKGRTDALEKRKKNDGDSPTRRIVARASHVEPDEELPRLKVALEAKQREIAELEDYRSRRLLELQAKLTELESKYTSAHPAVIDVQQNIAAASHESPQVAALRSEVKDLQAELERRGGRPLTSATIATSAPVTGEAAPLPSEIMDLIQNADDDIDPAVEAQLRYAIEKYTNLRSQISNARIDLDTAQVAFKHRYKIVVPPEAPTKALKPKVPVIIGAGLFAALILGLLSPILRELRSGRIVERWQVNELALPVLAELRFPPKSNKD